MPQNCIAQLRCASIHQNGHSIAHQLLAAFMLLATLIFAASVGAAEKQNFDIAAGPLGRALSDFAAAANVLLSFDPVLTEGKTSEGLSGKHSVDEGFDILLDDTELEVIRTDDNSFLIRSASQSGSAIDESETTHANKVSELKAITVEGREETALIPLDGFVARRSMTGTKTDTLLIEVPQSVSVIPREQMEDRNVQVESQALLYSAGVFAQPFGDSLNAFNNFYYIRGFPTSFGGSYVDGTVSPVNYRYEPYAYERIEVLRGPSSGLYGQSDPGGLINRVSKRPNAERQQEVILGYDNFNTAQISVDATGALDEDSQFLYRFTGTGSDGHLPTQDLRFDQELDEERLYAAPSFTWNMTPDTSLTLLASYQKDNTEELSPFIAPGYEVFDIRLDGNPGTEFNYHDYSIGYDFKHSFDDTLKVSQTFRYSGLDYDYNTLFNDVNAAFDGENIDRFADGFKETRKDVMVDTRVQKDVAFGMMEHTFLAGFDFQRLQDEYTFSFGSATTLNLLNSDYSTPFDADIDYFSEKATTYNYGLYAQDQIRVAEDWIVTLGVRQDWGGVETEDLLFGSTTKRNDRATSYRAGLSYQFDNGVAPYVSYAESFLPTSGTDIDGNAFEPTTGRQFEAGVKYQPESFPGFFTVAAYDLTKQNVVTPDPDNMSFSVQTGEIRSRGIELEATAELTENVKIQAAYAFNYSEVTKSNSGNEGDEASLAPRNLASVWVDYAFPASIADGLSIGGGVRYVGSNYAFDRTSTLTDRHKNKATTLIDAAIRYDLGRLVPTLDNAELALNVSNLFDRSYQVCYSRFNCQKGEPFVAMGNLTLLW